jgi:hypothetical protein
VRSHRGGQSEVDTQRVGLGLPAYETSQLDEPLICSTTVVADPQFGRQDAQAIVNQSDTSSFNIVPFQPEDIQLLLSPAPFQWWITGGWALDLFTDQKSRTHFDTDVAVARNDQTAARAYLKGWDFQYAVPGASNPAAFESWNPGETLEFKVHGSWARENRDSPWRFEFLLHEIDQSAWSFRYCQEVRHPLSQIGARTLSGIPYLRPEIVLLYKAARMRQVDDEDFRRVLPDLVGEQREQLRRDLIRFKPQHAWLDLLCK